MQYTSELCFYERRGIWCLGVHLCLCVCLRGWRGCPPCNFESYNFLLHTNEENFAMHYICLKKSSFSGDSRSYISKDSGDLKLVTVPALKTLVLQKECPVMLLVNFSDTSLNGLRGIVKEAKLDHIVVFFPTLNRQEFIKKHMFTVFTKRHQKDIACRLQIPVMLCYVTTVHIVQGLTLDLFMLIAKR